MKENLSSSAGIFHYWEVDTFSSPVPPNPINYLQKILRTHNISSSAIGLIINKEVNQTDRIVYICMLQVC